MGKKVGRPSIYSKKTTDHIVEQMALGRSLSSIIEQDEGMPSFATVFNWLDSKNGAFQQEFLEQYTRAKELQAHRMAEEIFTISDDSRGDTYIDEDGNERTNHERVNRSRLRVDTRKWFLSKVLPKLYGEKIQQEISGPDGTPLQVVVNINAKAPQK